MNQAVSPAVVALLRGVIEAALLAAVGALVLAVSEVTTGQLAPWAPIAILVLRQAEGVIDEVVDPTRQRVLGGRAAE